MDRIDLTLITAAQTTAADWPERAMQPAERELP